MPQVVSEWNKYFANSGVYPVIQPKDIEENPPPFLLCSHATLIIPRYWRAYRKFYDYIIIDESSLVLSNPKGRRIERVETLMKRRDKGLLLMSATPISKEIDSVYGHIKTLVPAIYRDWYAFARRHIIYKENSNFPQPIGVKGLHQIKAYLDKRSIRHIKEVVWDLPEPIISYRRLKLLPEQLEIYKDFKDFAFFENIDTDMVFDASYSPGLKYQKGLLACSNPNTFVPGTESCLYVDLLSVLSELEGAKLVVFFLYATTADHYAKKLEGDGYGVARLYDKYDELEKFQGDSQIICISMAKGSYGLNLQFARHLYLVELLPVPAAISQASNRVHRPGGEGSPTIYLPKIAGIYDKCLEKLGDRSKIVKSIIDIDKSILGEIVK